MGPARQSMVMKNVDDEYAEERNGSIKKKDPGPVTGRAKKKN